MLRLLTLDDCTERYVAWLGDPTINRYLESRWQEQTLESIRGFVETMRATADNYLFAIVEATTRLHIGNIKIGPVNHWHGYADVGYFIGERGSWGKGYATDAIRGVTRLGFERLGLARVQAGVYAGNAGSIRALEKASFRQEGCFRKQLVSDSGRDDHLFYGMLREEFGGLAPGVHPD